MRRLCVASVADVGCLLWQVRENGLRLLCMLADRDARRPFCAEGAWLVPELRYSVVHRELTEGRPRAKKLLAHINKTFGTLAFCRRWLEREGASPRLRHAVRGRRDNPPL